MKYRSKKDIAVMAPLCIGLLIPPVIGISFLFTPDIPKGAAGFVFLIWVVVVGFILLLTYPMYYEITPEILLVRSGLIRIQVPLNSIQQVFPERYWRSSPAWSLDRLRIEYRNRWGATFIHISPEDKFRFMHDLAAYADGLEVKDGRVVRRH